MQLFNSTSISSDWEAMQPNLIAPPIIDHPGIFNRPDVQFKFKATAMDDLVETFVAFTNYATQFNYTEFVSNDMQYLYYRWTRGVRQMPQSPATNNYRDPTCWDAYIYHYDR
jgi:hypothetical protein